MAVTVDVERMKDITKTFGVHINYKEFNASSSQLINMMKQVTSRTSWKNVIRI